MMRRIAPYSARTLQLMRKYRIGLRRYLDIIKAARDAQEWMEKMLDDATPEWMNQLNDSVSDKGRLQKEG